MIGELYASAGQVDLQVRPGNWMAGFAARGQPAQGIHDPLYARAMLLADGCQTLALVACDLVGLAAPLVADLRRRIAAVTPLREDHILICCSHTHSGPACAPLRGLMGRVDQEWLEQACERIVGLVAHLPTRLQPAVVACGSTRVPGIGYNRDDQQRPIDEELVAVAVETPGGETIATLANYSTHAVVLGPENLLLSGDYPGAVARRLEDQRGGVALFLQGACGDVDPVVYRDRGWGTGTFADCEEIGEQLAAAAARVLAGAERKRRAVIRVASGRVHVPLAPPPSAQERPHLRAGFETDLAAARDRGDVAGVGIGEAMLAWVDALEAALAGGGVPETLEAEAFAAQINGLCLVGIPFETYSDVGLAVKAALRPATVAFIGYANGIYCYLPTRWAKARGGYGAGDSVRWFDGMLTAPAAGADEVMVREVVALAKALVRE